MLNYKKTYAVIIIIELIYLMNMHYCSIWYLTAK